MDIWTSMACAELDIDAAVDLDRAVVLDLARTVNRVAARPTTAMTMYLFGVAVGRGMSAAEAVSRLTELAKRWQGDECDWRD